MPAPRPNFSIRSNLSLRWKAKTNLLIGQQLKKVNTTRDIIERSKNGKFEFGAFQMNGLAQGFKDGAVMGTPFGGPFTVGP